MNGMKRNVLAAFAAVTVTASLGGAIVAAAPTRARGAGELLQLTVTVPPTERDHAFDDATAQVLAVAGEGGTTVTLKVQGIEVGADQSAQFGAHVHLGPCSAGADTTSSHYNHSDEVPKAISEDTEVWLDFTVQPNGTAHESAHVSFAIPAGGAHSVVIHRNATNPVTGAAGAKLVCLPVEF